MLSKLAFGTTKQYSEQLHNHRDMASPVTSEITFNSQFYGSKCKNMLQDFVVSKYVIN